MKFQTMREYPSTVVERAVRLTNIAMQMNRVTVSSPDINQALAENAETDQELYDRAQGLV